jgi:hypothetical protein
MTSNTPEEQLLATLVRRFGGSEETPDLSEITEVATRTAEVLFPEVELDIKHVVNRVRESIAHRMGEGVSLVENDERHDPDWINSRAIDWNYSRAYEEYLLKENWPPKVVRSLGAVTLRIASYLQDPRIDGSWDRRGLVIGHVQSGKTANYLGLVARAADAGYKFIVVVAGIHNNLRQQTQERVDEGFVGEISDPVRRDRMRAEGKTARIGVGRDPAHRSPVALTSTANDFKRAMAENLRGRLDDWRKPVVVVIKKNRSTLDALIRWLREYNVEAGQNQIADLPMLFIDDEADNASINTNKPEIAPTTTNRLIRELLRLFRKSSYVGYTATPFANIFIDPASYGDEATCEDLFPRHFIYSLDAPNNYFGPNRIFLDEEGSRRHLREIHDCHDIIPLRHRKDDTIAELPLTLKNAIRTFLLARTIRNLRGQQAGHCTMLVNVSRFTNIQEDVRLLIDDYLTVLADACQSNGGLPADLANRNAHIAEIRSTFEAEYGDCGFGWNEVLVALPDAASAIQTAVVNSRSPEALNYTEYADRKAPVALTVIAVGGLSLSRGLTLEGLTVSYMFRNTKMYDTLLQMGRWFGYRRGYEDLCRIWLSAESIGWYTHISGSSEELRARIVEMVRSGQKPANFGLMVRSHPDALKVTAMNKMRHAETRSVAVSYDGRVQETWALQADAEVHDRNRQRVIALYRELATDHVGRRVEGAQRGHNQVWRGIPVELVRRFLETFEVHPQRSGTFASIRDYLDRIRDRFPDWDVAFISLRNRSGKLTGTDLGGWEMVHQERKAGRDAETDKIKVPNGGGYLVTNNQRVAGTGEEASGLSEDEMKRAAELASARGVKKATDLDFRHESVRGRPLLLVHLIDLKSPLADEEILLKGAPAIGLSFPATGEFATVEYVLNQVMIEELESEMTDDPDDEEDFDHEDLETRDGPTA